ncbi:MAG: hypothetical protein QOI80_3674 [Solirubrobacteraceae bacterium]|jgi:hypothetical protein|nr:hypothetical protein [Solirubrobacteraceae bacterium]
MAEKVRATDVVQKARRQLSELTGRDAENVLGVERLDGDDDGWRVTLELLELSRVPNTMDLLGCYVVRLDDDGELVEYSRTRRYARGQADEG